jgi:hypothetical protein
MTLETRIPGGLPTSLTLPDADSVFDEGHTHTAPDVSGKNSSRCRALTTSGLDTPGIPGIGKSAVLISPG